MQQLTTQDSIFLSMETPELPGHIGGLAFLAPTEGYDFSYDSFVEFVRDRLGSVERFSWALQEVPFGLDRPYWVKQDDFDPGDHVPVVPVAAFVSQSGYIGQADASAVDVGHVLAAGNGQSHGPSVGSGSGRAGRVSPRCRPPAGPTGP